MRCTVCNRPMTKAAATINSRGGPLHFGPECARRAGLTPAAVRLAKLRTPIRRVRVEETQIPLELELEAT